MPSSYTPSLRLEEQGIGENENTWGNKLNVVLDLIDKSIAGHVSVAVSSGDVVLTSVNSAEDQARYKIVELTGTLTADVNIQVPEVSKDYVIWDSTTRGGFAINLRLGAAGATTAVPATTVRGFAVATDGTSWRPSSPSEATQTLAGIVRYATTAEAQAGTSTTLALSPSTLQDVTATETRAGVVELATDAEAQTGTDTARAITPANLQAVTATETRKGVVELATDAEAQAGTDTERALTPASLQSVTATEARKGVIEIATQTEVNAQTDALRAVTPATLAGMTASTNRVGVLKLASIAETTAGTNTTNAITPARLEQRVAALSLGTASTVDYEYTTFNLSNFSETATVHAVKIGKQVTLFIDEALSHTSASNWSSSAGDVPVRFRPIATYDVSVMYTYFGGIIREVYVDDVGRLGFKYFDTTTGSSSQQTNTGNPICISYIVP